MMGVPVLTVFDNVKHYHSQNVTSSLMTNSGMSDYVVNSNARYIEKALEFSNNLESLYNLKQTTRENFVNGAVCDYTNFVNEFEDKIINLYIDFKYNKLNSDSCHFFFVYSRL